MAATVSRALSFAIQLQEEQGLVIHSPQPYICESLSSKPRAHSAHDWSLLRTHPVNFVAQEWALTFLRHSMIDTARSLCKRTVSSQTKWRQVMLLSSPTTPCSLWSAWRWMLIVLLFWTTQLWTVLLWIVFIYPILLLLKRIPWCPLSCLQVLPHFATQATWIMILLAWLHHWFLLLVVTFLWQATHLWQSSVRWAVVSLVSMSDPVKIFPLYPWFDPFGMVRIWSLLAFELFSLSGI